MEKKVLGAKELKSIQRILAVALIAPLWLNAWDDVVFIDAP
jgi:hypothetical protein